MSFNFLIDSNNNINQLNQNPTNTLVVDPSLNYFYTFEPEDLSGNTLKNQGISQAYDLTINSGVVDGAFDGTPIAATISNSITLNNSYSIGFWVYFNNNTDQIIFLFGTTNSYSNGVSMYYRAGTTQLNFRDETPTNQNGTNNLMTTVPITTWTHIVWVNSGGTTWTCYKNGVSVNVVSGKTSNSSFIKNFNFIGRGTTASPLNLNGQLDGFFVYQGELSAAQILEIYQKGQQPTQTNYFYTIPIQPKTYSYANNKLQYYFDFSRRPLHPYGGNRYKVYSSFISFGTPTVLPRTNQQSYYIVDGLGTFETFIGRGGNPTITMPNNHLVKNITLKRSTNFVGNQYNQKWIDLDPTMPMIIQNLNETGIINVEIRLINNNNLSSNVVTWGAQAFSYAIQLLFEPIP